MAGDDLAAAVASVPPGAWAVGVSGGADSVALLLLLRRYRSDLSLVVVHLNHETRGAQSDADAAFVEGLARAWGLPSVVGRWRDWGALLDNPPTNRSARFRAGRLALFQSVVHTRSLRGVILAHHADDLAETVLQRLLRGAGPAGLAPVRSGATIAGLIVLRPLLAVRRDALRRLLAGEGLAWREDESNRSASYQRNRLRFMLAERPWLTEHLLELGRAAAAMKDWTRRHSPTPRRPLPVAVVRELPPPLATDAARRWLVAQGVPAGKLDRAVLNRLIEMTTDAASPPRRHFPGGVLVRRRAGVLFVDKEADDPWKR